MTDYTWELHGDKVAQAQIIGYRGYTNGKRPGGKNVKQRDFAAGTVMLTVKATTTCRLRIKIQKTGAIGALSERYTKNKKTTP